jgi:autotransporter-associated beta strand protein
MKKQAEAVCFWATAMMLSSISIQAADLLKANNTDDLNLGSSWTGGIVPGASDIAVWADAVGAANTTVLGSDLAWSGIKVLTPGGPVTIGAGKTLTNGSGGIDLSQATQDLTLGCELYLNGAQTLSVANGRTLTIAGSVASSGTSIPLHVNGGGTVRWTGTAKGDESPVSLGNLVPGNNVELIVDGGRLAVYKTGDWGNGTGDATIRVTNNAVFRIPWVSGSSDFNMRSGITIDISSGEFHDRADGTCYLGRYASKPCRLAVRGSGKLLVAYRRWHIGFQGSGSTLTVADNGEADFGNGLTLGDKTTNHFVYVYGGTLAVKNDLCLGNPIRDPITGGFLIMTNGLACVGGLGTRAGTSMGKGTVVLSGGRLMIGSKGIWLASNGGTSAMDITLSGGMVGATVNWSTAVPMTLTNDTGDITFQAADTNDAPYDIALAGVLSGVGGFKKTGGGTLTLSGTNTYAGATVVSNGTLRLTQGSALSTSTGVVLSGSSVLNLDFVGTNVVRSLQIGDRTVTRGLYSAANTPGRLTGTGFLLTTEPPVKGTLLSVL